MLKRLSGCHPLCRIPHKQTLQEVQALWAAGEPGTIVQGDVVHDDCLHDLIQRACPALSNAGPARQQAPLNAALCKQM